MRDIDNDDKIRKCTNSLRCTRLSLKQKFDIHTCHVLIVINHLIISPIKVKIVVIA
jgi:hypothetical protein